MPVLDGNLDELSDARSLAASIKGGGTKKPVENEEDPDDNEVATLTSSARSSVGYDFKNQKINIKNLNFSNFTEPDDKMKN